MLTVKIKPLHKGFKLPVKGSEDAACYDAHITDMAILSDGVVVCQLGFSTEIPEDWKGVIVPRSNITKHGYAMLNSPAQVDSDYRGEWIVKFQPVTNPPQAFPYFNGNRCCQIYFERVNFIEFKIVDSISDSERGEGGFGSTGNNYK